MLLANQTPNFKKDFAMMTREICKLCFNPVRVGFNVPDEIWDGVTEGRFNVLCLDCFTKIADEKMVEWDKDIEFFPVSWYTMLQETQS